MELARATLERFRQGDAQAFRQVVQKYTPLVRAAVSRFFRSGFQREEAMQEIWMLAFRNREALDLERAASFSGWLATLAHRKCIDLVRSTTDPGLKVDVTEQEALAWLAAAPPAEDQAEREELSEAVRAFKQKLDPEWRDFFELHFVQGLDYEAVGSQLGISARRCKYMRAKLSARARRDAAIMAALGRRPAGRDDVDPS